MKVIDLATVKLYLGISDSADDALINKYIPIIDSKVKSICNNNFNLQINVKLVNGSDIVEIYGTGGRCITKPELDLLLEELPTGTLLEGTGIATGTYIDEVYYSEPSNNDLNVPSIKLSQNATADNSNAYIYAGINIAYQEIIAKGLWYLTGRADKTIKDDSWKSRRIGPVSITKGEGGKSELDGKSGMPLWFVRALPRYH